MLKPPMKKLQTLAESLGIEDTYVPLAENREPQTIQEFCESVLTSKEYRQSIRDRIALGNLPPAIELRLYDYAYGKPVDKVEHTGKDGNPIETITEVRRVIVRTPVDEESREIEEVVH